MFENTVAIFFALSWIGMAAAARHYYEAYKIERLRSESKLKELEDAFALMEEGRSLRDDLMKRVESGVEAVSKSRSLEEQVARQKDWHDKAMGVVISERDRWRDLHHELDTNFDATVAFYERALAYYMAKAGKSMSESEKKHKAEVERVRQSIKVKMPDIVSATLVRNQDGFLQEESKA